MRRIVSVWLLLILALRTFQGEPGTLPEPKRRRHPPRRADWMEQSALVREMERGF